MADHSAFQAAINGVVNEGVANKRLRAMTPDQTKVINKQNSEKRYGALKPAWPPRITAQPI